MAVSVVFLISILISGVKKKGEKQWNSYAICPVWPVKTIFPAIPVFAAAAGDQMRNRRSSLPTVSLTKKMKD